MLEAIGTVDIVIAFQDRTPQALAETPWAQEYRNLVLFQFADKASLIDEVIVADDDLFIIRYRVGNFFRHKKPASHLAPLGFTHYVMASGMCQSCRMRVPEQQKDGHRECLFNISA